MEIELFTLLVKGRTLSLNPCYTGMEIEHESMSEQDVAKILVLILVILEWR